MRLIDADELVRNILSQTIMNETDAKIMDRYLYCINNQPPAYDIDKVVEELKDLGSKYCTNVSCNYECKDCSHGILMQKAIEIVEQGYAEEKEYEERRIYTPYYEVKEIEEGEDIK